MSQFLRLDTNKYVTEPLMSLLFVLSTDQIELEESSQVSQSSHIALNLMIPN